MFKYVFIILLISTATKTCNQENTEEKNRNEMQEKTTSIDPLNRLHDIWALTAIEGEDINKERFSAGVPTLEIFVEDKSIGGFSGCNNYFASIEYLDENKIVLGAIASSKKYCFEVDENIFFEQMNKVQRYHLEKMQLFLFEGDELLLTFKKVD
jgi:heat shock protein HslJ